ncbi:MAG: nitroreductase [Lachnospiraceae bacterium]|nr:nitroreductase family protein [Lachnospira sp.]MBR6696821.1 nitroreductase [Lachnospiraceae bacterium]
MNETMNTIYTRRSCKKYLSELPPMTMIDEIIHAGLCAASGLNRQSPIIVAVTDADTRNQLSKLNSKYDFKHREDPFYNAPVVLIVLADKSIPTAIYDGSLVLGNMMLAAHSMGLGSCWIHRAKEMFEDEEGKAILDKLGITGDYEGIGNCIIGYADMDMNKDIPRRENRVYKIF